jgi:hypothetical protein
MNKLWKSTVVFILIVGFLVATLVCCCVTRLAQAAMIQTKAKSVCCHAQTNGREHKTKKCDTCLKNNFSEETSTIFNVVPSNAVKSLPMDSVSFMLPVRFSMRLVDSHGPPELLPDLPFYLKVHSLRI